MVPQKIQDRKKIVVIDGFAILHRAYHALPALTNRSGELQNAVYGFCSILFKIADDLRPAYLMVAFDTFKQTFRNKEYLGYQAKRPETAVELASQVEKTRKIIEAFGIPLFERDGFEADDVIATLVTKIIKDQKKSEVGEIIIVTGDRDLFQLVNDKVKLYMPIKGLSEAQLFGEKEVEEKMGVKTSQIVDYKALVGDSSDNYPGVVGIGPKGAIGLLRKYGSFEKIYKSLEKIEPLTLRQKLIDGEEGGRLSKKLATTVTDVPLDLDLEKAKIKDFRNERVMAVLRELRFKSLVARLTKENNGRKEKTKKQKLEDTGQMSLI